MDKVKNILIIVLSLIITLLYTCRGKLCSDQKVVYKDSIIVKSDTIWTKDTVYSFKSYKPKAKDSVKTIEYTILDHGPCQYKRFYQDSLVDSNLTIYTSDTTLGLLLGKSISYRPKKKPELITTTTTITKTPELEKKFKLFIGGEFGGNKGSFSFSPKITLESKKENIYSYRYDVINKTHNIGFGVNILSKRKK